MLGLPGHAEGCDNCLQISERCNSSAGRALSQVVEGASASTSGRKPRQSVPTGSSASGRPSVDPGRRVQRGEHPG